MKTPTTSFRLEKWATKGMDELITNPPSIAVDAKKGEPRNRTELVENLIRAALAAQREEVEKPLKKKG